MSLPDRIGGIDVHPSSCRRRDRLARRRNRDRGAPKVVTLPNSDPQCFAPWAAQHQAVPVPGEEGAVPDRARQRLYRQHVADPDDQDRQGLCRAARRRREAQGVQGRLDRRGRRRADRGDQQLHRLRLRRDRRERAEPGGVQAGDQARQRCGRRAGRLRQHPRHRGGDQRQRRPEGPRQVLGRVAREERAERRQGPRGARRLRHVGRPRPARGHPRGAQGLGQEVGRGRGDRQVGRPHGAEGDGRRDRRAQEVRRDHRAGRRHRRGAGDDRRQASVRALRRRNRERLPQVLRQVRRRRA